MKRIMMAAAFLTALSGVVLAVEDIEKDFRLPPVSARPSGYWWWFNSLVDKEGITRDLEEFKAKGMGGVMLVCSGNDYGVAAMPRGPVFLSPEWRELYKHALKEAARLGLEVGVNFAPGWCMGGPWITPEFSCRWFVQTNITITGPMKFQAQLPVPGYRDGYLPPHQGNVGHYMTWPREKADYRDTAVVAFREPEGGNADLEPERMAHLAAKSNRKDGSCMLPARTAMDQTLVAWTNRPGDKPIAPADVVDLTAKLKPDGTLDWNVPEGRWTVIRTGHAVIGADVRCVLPEIGYVLEVDWFNPEAVDLQFKNLGEILLADAGSLAGKTLKYFASDSFEDGYPNWTAGLLKKFRECRGYDPIPYLPVFRGKLVGSAEISDRFLYDYRKTVADCMADGNYGRFAELSRKHGLDIQCEAAGPSWSGTVCMDGLKNLGRCERPQGEFWQDGTFVVNGQNKVGKQTASAAHIYGRRTASTESFTGFGHWNTCPGNLKPVADRAFCEGINRFLFHTMTATRPQDGLPGYEYGAGSHFNPNITWWQQAAGPWLIYVNRCQAMLQSGQFVADVLYYNGDWAPNLVEPKHVDPSLGKGYDYDVCNAEVLLTRLSVKNGRLVLPDGLSYRLLVLPDSRRMPVEVAEKIRKLVKAGATVVGPRPESDPGLKGYPDCDADVKKIAAAVWGNCDGQTIKQHSFGKGRVVQGMTLREMLLAEGVQPDFEYSGNKAFIDFIHRTVDDAEVYFLANRNNTVETVQATFRVAGRLPELWDPVTGEKRDLGVFALNDGRTTVPLTFEPFGSMFIVFRKKGGTLEGASSLAGGVGWTNRTSMIATNNFPELKVVQELSGSWDVQFDPKWFYDEKSEDGGRSPGKDAKVVFEKLEDWSARQEPSVKNFSGTATYRKTFTLVDEAGRTNGSGSGLSSRIFLGLGTVKETARVKLNGRELGVLWCAPWRAEITSVVKAGENVLEIEVVNLWPNRLIGDAGLPVEKRRTRTNVLAFKKDSKLMSSGLLGPVSVMRAD